MHIKTICYGVLLMLASILQPVAAADLYLVANPALKISASDALSAYLGEKEFFKATRLRPVENASIQVDFLQRVMDMNIKQYQVYWTKKTFRDGVMPPVVLSSDAEVLMFIQKTPGAIGYLRIPSDAVTVLKRY